MVNKALLDGLYAPALRSFLALFIVTFSAFLAVPPFRNKGGFPIHLTFMWAAMTNFFIAAPKIGSLAKVGIQHFLGTVMGGLCGVGIVLMAEHFRHDRDGDPPLIPLDNFVWYTACMSTVGIVSNFIGWRWKVPDTSMLFTVSCILIVFATEDLNGAEHFMESRIMGMLGGVVLSQVLAVTVFPKAATKEVVCHLHSVLQGLAELNEVAWSHAGMHAEKPLSEKDGSKLPATNTFRRLLTKGRSGDNWLANPRKEETGYNRLSAGVCKGGACEVVQEMLNDKLERALMSVYKGLELAEAALPITRTEIAVKLCKGNWIFLPSLPCIPRMPLPEEELADVAWSIRKCARILWTLHLTFQDGLDQEMIEVLKQQYPKDLMRNLKMCAQEAFWDILEAFPYDSQCRFENMRDFGLGVEALFAINDFQRRRIAEHTKKYRNMAMEAEVKRNTDFARLRRRAQEHMLRANTQPTSMFKRALTSVNKTSVRLNARDNEVNDITAPLLANDESAPRTTVDMVTKSFSDNLDLSLPPISEGNSIRGETSGTSKVSANVKEALERLPAGVQVKAGSGNYGKEVEKGTVRYDVPTVSDIDLKDFPNTAEGYVSMVRWYSFQFLLEELQQDMTELCTNMSKLLKDLPDFGLSL